MELDETARDCAIREVREETGLLARGVTPFGIYTRLGEAGPNQFGHTYQHITIACRVDGYTGELCRVTDETTDAAWYPADALPEGRTGSVDRTLADLAAFELEGRFAFE